MGRYITAEEFQEHMELDTLNETDQPKESTVDKWIVGAEAELDTRTTNQWDTHTVTDELISPAAQTNEFVLRKQPLQSITILAYQNGTDFDPDWVTIPSSEYKTVNSNTSKIRTETLYWQEEGLRITYVAGFVTIPDTVKELALMLTEKRYLMSRLGIAAADTDVVSVAVIRIRDKSNASLKYKIEALDAEIISRIAILGRGMKSRNAALGFMNLNTQPIKRYRLY